MSRSTNQSTISRENEMHTRRRRREHVCSPETSCQPGTSHRRDPWKDPAYLLGVADEHQAIADDQHTMPKLRASHQDAANDYRKRAREIE